MIKASPAFAHEDEVGTVVLRFLAMRPEVEGLSDAEFGEIICLEKLACSMTMGVYHSRSSSEVQLIERVGWRLRLKLSLRFGMRLCRFILT